MIAVHVFILLQEVIIDIGNALAKRDCVEQVTISSFSGCLFSLAKPGNSFSCKYNFIKLFYISTLQATQNPYLVLILNMFYF